jgi:hypothetical protein
MLLLLANHHGCFQRYNRTTTVPTNMNILHPHIHGHPMVVEQKLLVEGDGGIVSLLTMLLLHHPHHSEPVRGTFGWRCTTNGSPTNPERQRYD